MLIQFLRYQVIVSRKRSYGKPQLSTTELEALCYHPLIWDHIMVIPWIFRTSPSKVFYIVFTPIAHFTFEQREQHVYKGIWSCKGLISTLSSQDIHLFVVGYPRMPRKAIRSYLIGLPLESILAVFYYLQACARPVNFLQGCLAIGKDGPELYRKKDLIKGKIKEKRHYNLSGETNLQ